MMGVRLFRPFPTSLKYFLLYSIPSLAVIGLLNLARRRWFRVDRGRKRVSNSVPSHSNAKENVEGCAELAHEPRRDRNDSSGSLETGVVGDSYHLPQSDDGKLFSNGEQASGSKSTMTDTPKDNGGLPEVGVSEVDVSGEDIKSKSLSNSHSLSADVRDTSEATGGSSSQSEKSSLGSPRTSEDCKDSKTEDASGISETTDSSKRTRVRMQLQLQREVIGRFIGKQGRNIKALMQESGGAYVYLNQKSVSKESGVVPCTIQGTSKQVDEALAIIERKFPEICIAEALVNTPSMPQTSLPQPLPSSSVFPTPPCSTVPAISANGSVLESWECELQLASIPTKSFSATVSYIEGLRHVWVVPRDMGKEMDELHRSMSYNYCYSGALRHTLPMPSDSQTDLFGRFCAVRVSEIHWLRGRIVKFGDDMLTYEVQLVDYGSYVIVPPSSINPLRKEYCKLPVLAFKTQLAHIRPVKETSTEALLAMQRMMENMTLELHITGKVSFSSGSVDKKDKDLSVWFSSLPSSNGETEKPVTSQVNGKEVHKSREESDAEAGERLPNQASEEVRCTSEISLISEHSINGDSGFSGMTKSFDLNTPGSSHGECSSQNSDCADSEEVMVKERSATKREDSIITEDIESNLEERLTGSDKHQGKNESEGDAAFPVNKIKPSSENGCASDRYLESSSHSTTKDSALVEKPLVNGNHTSPDKRALTVEDIEMGYDSHLSDLAAYIPVVEIYTQLGSQTPTFVNRELVELGHAIWIEEKFTS